METKIGWARRKPAVGLLDGVMCCAYGNDKLGRQAGWKQSFGAFRQLWSSRFFAKRGICQTLWRWVVDHWINPPKMAA